MLNSKINTIKYSYIIYSTVPMTQTYIDAERYTPYMNSPACVPVLPITGSPKACRCTKLSMTKGNVRPHPTNQQQQRKQN